MEYYISFGRLPTEILGRRGRLLRFTAPITALCASVVIITSVVTLIVELSLISVMITSVLFGVCSLFHQATVYFATRKTMDMIKNNDTIAVLKVLCDMSAIVCITCAIAMLRVVTDCEIFDVCCITVGSYTFVQYGKIRDYNCSFRTDNMYSKAI